MVLKLVGSFEIFDKKSKCKASRNMKATIWDKQLPPYLLFQFDRASLLARKSGIPFGELIWQCVGEPAWGEITRDEGPTEIQKLQKPY